MAEPRAHLCLYIPELDFELHLDITAEGDIIDECCSGLVMFLTHHKQNILNKIEPEPEGFIARN